MDCTCEKLARKVIIGNHKIVALECMDHGYRTMEVTLGTLRIDPKSVFFSANAPPNGS